MNLNFWDKYSQENGNWGFRKPELKIWGFMKDISTSETSEIWHPPLMGLSVSVLPSLKGSSVWIISWKMLFLIRLLCREAELPPLWSRGLAYRRRKQVSATHLEQSLALCKKRNEKKKRHNSAKQWMGTFMYVIQKHSDSTVSNPSCLVPANPLLHKTPEWNLQTSGNYHGVPRLFKNHHSVEVGIHALPEPNPRQGDSGGGSRTRELWGN